MTAVILLDRLRPAFLIFMLLSLAGCATPLGPGFALRRETVNIHYAQRPTGSAVYYSVQAVARNTGNRPLDQLRIRAPRLATPGQAQAALSSQTGPSTSGSDQRDGLPVPLQSPLLQGQSRQIPFAYLIPVQGEVVFLDPEGWFPSFLPPKGLFAKAQQRASKTQLDIYVPRDDRVLTTGRLRRVRSGPPGGESEYVYEIRDKDFSPFLLIGKYEQQSVRVRGQAVVFWSRKPFDPVCAQAVANEAVATTQLYRSVFGRPNGNLGTLRIIEFPTGGPSGSNLNTGMETVPNGVLFSEDPAEACRQLDTFYFLVARNLAATWFGWAVRPASGAEAVLGSGVQNYAALIAEEKQETPGIRRRQVADWLAEYDRLNSRTHPLPPSALGSHPTGDQLRMAGVQSALFFIALEDRLGSDPVRRALKDIVGSLGGTTAGPNELRSALEREGGKNLYDFFNQWLSRAGVPAAFRRRYSVGN